MRLARDREQFHLLVPLQHVRRLQIDEIAGIDRARHQCRRARRRILDRDHLDRIEMGAAGFPVVRIALHDGFHARLESLEDEAAGADALGEFSFVLLHHAQGLQGHDVREADIALLEDDGQFVFAGCLHLGHRLQDRGGGRGRPLDPVAVQRIDRVFGVEGLAIVEGDALAQLEHPGLGIGRAFPAFGQFRDENTARTEFDQVVAQLAEQEKLEISLVKRGIETVGRGEIAHADLQGAARLRRCRTELARQPDQAGRSSRTDEKFATPYASGKRHFGLLVLPTPVDVKSSHIPGICKDKIRRL